MNSQPNTKELKKIINGGHNALPPHLISQFEFLEQMNREMDSMVLAWRHKVDHAVNSLREHTMSEFENFRMMHRLGSRA